MVVKKIIITAIKKKMNNIKLRNKLFISFVFVVFIPVITVGTYLTNELRQLALDDTVQQVNINMERVRKRTIEVLKVPYYVSNNLQLDQDLERIVNTEYQSIHHVVESYRSYNVFYNYTRTYDEIYNIRFYMDNPTLLNNWYIMPSDEVENLNWYKDAVNGKVVANWLYIKDETNNNEKYLSLVRRINFFDFNTMGVVVVSLNPKILHSILSQESAPTMLIDEENYIVATNKQNYKGKELNQVVNVKAIGEGQTGIFQGSVDNQNSQIFVEDIPLDTSNNKLRIVSIITDEAIVENANRFKNMGIIVITVSFLIAILFIYYISKLLSNRLLRLTKQVKQVGKGDFNTSIVIDGDDEIGRLSNQLDIMVRNMKELLDEVYQSNKQKLLMERKQNEIRFKMLASQINPHFLFNTLESIRMEAHSNGQDEIARIINKLGMLMRNSIEVGSGKVSVKSEIQVVQNYLEIQKFRYGERLDFVITMDQSTERILIPPLIIQPLVENALIHGIENSENRGKVWVNTKMTETGLLVEVIDNGIGISEKRKDYIYRSFEELEEKVGGRIGLRNIHQRLQLSYGKMTGINIENKIDLCDTGTNIFFIIPNQED